MRSSIFLSQIVRLFVGSVHVAARESCGNADILDLELEENGFLNPFSFQFKVAIYPAF
jgi:hypothetical protein